MKNIRTVAVSLLLSVGFAITLNAQTCPPSTGCLDTSFNGTGKVFTGEMALNRGAVGVELDGTKAPQAAWIA